MAFIIGSILKSPKLLGILKFHNKSLNWAEILKSIFPCLSNYVVNLSACNQCSRILLEKAGDNIPRCYTRSIERQNSGNLCDRRPPVF